MKKKIEIDLPDTVKAIIDKKLAARDAAQKSKVDLKVASKVDDRIHTQFACTDLVMDTKTGAFTKESMKNCEIAMFYRDDEKENTIKAGGAVKFDAESPVPEHETEFDSVPMKSCDETVRSASLRMKTQLTDEIASEIYCPDIQVDTINDKVVQDSLKDCQTRLIMLDKGSVPSKPNPLLAAIKFSHPVPKLESMQDNGKNADVTADVDANSDAAADTDDS